MTSPDLTALVPFQDHHPRGEYRCECGWRPNIGEPSTTHHEHLMLQVLRAIDGDASESPPTYPHDAGPNVYPDDIGDASESVQPPERGNAPLIEHVTTKEEWNARDRE